MTNKIKQLTNKNDYAMLNKKNTYGKKINYLTHS